MSGSLANRLVQAAEAKLNELHSADGVVSYPTAARWATAAVLRELDRAVMEQVMARSNDVIDLAELAEVVERGEQQ